MIGVGFKRNGKITCEARYMDGELETAMVLGEGLARHNRGEVLVYLYKKDRPGVKVLKRIRLTRTGFLGLGRKVVTT